MKRPETGRACRRQRIALARRWPSPCPSSASRMCVIYYEIRGNCRDSNGICTHKTTRSPMKPSAFRDASRITGEGEWCPGVARVLWARLWVRSRARNQKVYVFRGLAGENGAQGCTFLRNLWRSCVAKRGRFYRIGKEIRAFPNDTRGQKLLLADIECHTIAMTLAGKMRGSRGGHRGSVRFPEGTKRTKRTTNTRTTAFPANLSATLIRAKEENGQADDSQDQVPVAAGHL